ncbi:hypothetical protein GYA54_02640 [Candidatus Kuenenbacteria bacterium]|nr:hypothetical protein [Candidatus Kuenenbacteria bacterium]
MKNNRWIILVLLILIISGTVFIKLKQPKQTTKQEINISEKSAEIAPVEEKEKKPIKVIIISPKEEMFQARQARMWSAKIDNFEDEYGKFGFCEWRFYLNENNEEVLYKEQTVRTVLSAGGDNTCAFTSTFIEKVGKLRVEVTVLIKDFQENLIETFKAERNYIVD